VSTAVTFKTVILIWVIFC